MAVAAILKEVRNENIWFEGTICDTIKSGE